MPGPVPAGRDRPLEKIVAAMRRTVVSHPAHDKACTTLRKFLSAREGAVCLVTGPHDAGRSTVARAVFGPRKDALVVRTPAGPLAGRGFRATRLLEAILRTGKAPMVDGLVAHQLPLTTRDGRVLVIMPDPSRQGGRDAAEATLVGAISQMKKYRGVRFLVLDDADPLVGLSNMEHVDWILRVAREVGLRLVLVTSNHTAATVLEKLSHAVEWHLVEVQRYTSRSGPGAFTGFRDALEELLEAVPEVRFPPLESTEFYYVSCYSLGCFGLACKYLETLVARALAKQGAARGILTVEDLRLDGDDEERLHALLTSIEEGEGRLRNVVEAGRDGRTLHQRLGLAVPSELKSASEGEAEPGPALKGNGIHRPRVGDPALDRIGEAQIAELGF